MEREILVEFFLSILVLGIVGTCVVYVAVNGNKKTTDLTGLNSLLVDVLIYGGLIIALFIFAVMFLVVPIRALS